MIRLALLTIALAFFAGLTGGLSRSLLFAVRRGSRSFGNSAELGFFIPSTLLLILGALMLLPWGEADVHDKSVFGFLWRATLLYFLAWAVIGRRVQGAVEHLAHRKLARRKA